MIHDSWFRNPNKNFVGVHRNHGVVNKQNNTLRKAKVFKIERKRIKMLNNEYYFELIQ